MVAHQPKASKGIKVAFAAACLLSFAFYGTFKQSTTPLSDTFGRRLQEEEEFDCSIEFSEQCPDNTCELFGTTGCCNEILCFIQSSDSICERSDFCLAEIFPGANGDTGDGKCFAPFERNRVSGIIVYLFFLLYLFLAVAIICDDYFVPCLEKISDALSLSDDVAGATFMAAGSSAPELFVSLSDNVIASPPKSLGLGAVVGGGIFNVCVIIGLSALFAGKELDLNWRPFARDYFFYFISIGLLVLFAANDGEIKAEEGIILFLVYVVYVIFMVYNSVFFIWLDQKLGILEIADEEGDGNKNEESLEDKPEEIKDDEEPQSPKRRMSKAEALKQYSSFRTINIEKEIPPSYWHMFSPPSSVRGAIYYILSLPINIAFRFTVPDSNYDIFREDKEGKKENRRWGYSLSFIMCIVWIGILSQFLVFCTTMFGCLVGIDPAIMGLTLLAVGTNIPDALSSIIVARNGKGDMAVANSIGSNVFDILVGLGLPWFIAALAIEPVPVEVGDITLALGFLGGSLAFLFGVLMIRKWKMDKILGGLLLSFYFIYVIVELSLQ